MYNTFRLLGEKWLRIPPQPEPPPGDEASARVFRASPKYLSYLRIVWAIRTVFTFVVALVPILAVGIAVFRRESGGIIVAASVVAILILGFLVASALFRLALVQLDFEKRWYLVTDRSLRIREGVLFVREMTFTFANIQNLSITQGPIQRLLGIADLKVETAGGGSGAGKNPEGGVQQNLHTAFFRGIDNAEEVKQLIAARMRSHRDSGLGDTDDHSLPALLPTRSETPPADSIAPVQAALQAVLEEAKALRRSVGAAN
ncbi:MAG: PH domain-containing protein [Verrucomicrobiota bacterium]